MSDIDSLIRRYDAEPSTGLTAAEAARAEELLTQIIATPRGKVPVAVGGLTRPRIAFGLVGVAAAVAAVTLGGHVVGPRTGSDAATLTSAELAAWTAVPTHPAPSPAIEHTAAECLTTLGIATGGTPAVSNIDQRGSVITLTATDPASRERAWCLATATGVVTSKLVDAPGAPLPAIGQGEVNIQSEDAFAAGSADVISLAYGEAGTGVTSVVVTTYAGVKVTATVQDGLWTLWWPGLLIVPRDLATETVTWTTIGGVTQTAPATSLIADRGSGSQDPTASATASASRALGEPSGTASPQPAPSQ
jgi:hypothetical protein